MATLRTTTRHWAAQHGRKPARNELGTWSFLIRHGRNLYTKTQPWQGSYATALGEARGRAALIPGACELILCETDGGPIQEHPR